MDALSPDDYEAVAKPSVHRVGLTSRSSSTRYQRNDDVDSVLVEVVPAMGVHTVVVPGSAWRAAIWTPGELKLALLVLNDKCLTG